MSGQPASPHLECTVCASGVTSPHGATETAGQAATDDPFGGHEFAYESHTDLFRCVRCHGYEVTAREGDTIKPCTGQPPAGSEPIEVNAW